MNNKKLSLLIRLLWLIPITLAGMYYIFWKWLILGLAEQLRLLSEGGGIWCSAFFLMPPRISNFVFLLIDWITGDKSLAITADKIFHYIFYVLLVWLIFYGRKKTLRDFSGEGRFPAGKGLLPDMAMVIGLTLVVFIIPQFERYNEKKMADQWNKAEENRVAKQMTDIMTKMKAITTENTEKMNLNKIRGAARTYNQRFGTYPPDLKSLLQTPFFDFEKIPPLWETPKP